MEAITATGTFFDGLSARPQPVTLRLTFRLEVSGEDVSRDWSLLDLRAADAAPPLMRINHAQGSESVEFADAAFAEALTARCPDLNRTESGGGLTRLVLWSIAAGVSVLLTAVYGVPAASNLLAPLVPQAIEAQLGRSVDAQIVGLLDDPPLCNEAAGRAVLDRLTARLAEGMALPTTPQVSVRQHKVANALALPGGRVILLSDILAKAKSGDELAGILAHEFGHIAARDPMRSVITAGGTSFLLSLVLGDLTGSTVLVTIGQAAISAGYSRDAERTADAYAVAAVKRAGGDAAALAAILERITDADDEKPDATSFLRSHPVTAERAARIRSLAGEKSAGPGILSEAEWQSLQGICPKPTKPEKTKPDDKDTKTPTEKL
ncbi:UNVERIFIED_ORG: Zn-dependent protease with chaperone function [Methylobacterium sp. SuP10 SLI 274]|uniref:M48 family metallopeptidase n=1 Tax=Methylorubrum extorquens TaxID=408 RepID=UPI0020A09A4D|nr:M48 family metallopeptidase [Methylorubrum extorquens]MDF9865753.1 Zn-dependent protease with chaperone function [Methylorubrum pseudosasae]MDH6639315.1 Zn-dependent protease with chaperone function [Methylobacterium sp. SuP10 SLI 274]MDH6668504.1 Zn-dependent protease with chaperone function [Methylorubrum zatmanii]MCP1560389.1 Zn-dependent protease with chaperone function [Methylorubrum extorquens]MDF9794057.1 Zn-dependent protease with chaperone function [Methylorubrum extorquens]